MPACVFCQIAREGAAAHRVFESSDACAFLDVRPLFVGHVLVVPKAHHETLADLPLDRVAPFFTAVRAVARAVPIAMKAQGSFVAMNNKVSQSVPHLHAHVVPRTKGDGLKGFFWPRTTYANEDAMKDVAARIAREIEASET